MSTRGIIVYIGKGKYSTPQGFRLYQHCDSYPTGILPLLKTVIRKAEKCVAAEDSGRRTVTPEMLAGFTVGEQTGIYGMGAHIEEAKPALHISNEDAIFELLGNQGDLEWVYVVDTDAQTINVYGGGYSNTCPEGFVKAGTVDPLVYVENLIEEYQEGEAKRIKSAIRSLKRLGWPVNPPKKGKTGRRAAIEATKAKAA